MSKEKIVPQNLIDIWNEYVGACEARDYAAKGFFKFQVRNAVWLGRIAAEFLNINIPDPNEAV